MANFFRGNTQPSTLQQTIEKITDGNQSNEDWSLIMNLCDFVNTHDESAKEVMKIIRKRLQINPVANGWRGIGYTLTLLEALVKNCGKMFHLQIAHKDFLKELKNVIGPKNNPPVPVQERVLGMIQTWALAFRSDPDLKAVDHFYQECKQQGLAFPPPESENAIRASVPATGTIERPIQSTVNPISQPSLPSSSNQVMSAEHLAKLRSELDVVQTNAQVFGEMLVTLQPGEEDPQDFELLMELHNTCKQMQARIVDLLSQISIDEITVDLLRCNDEFLNSFKTFEQYIQERDRRLSSTHNMPKSNTNTNINTINQEPLLINFDDEPIQMSTTTASTNNNNNNPDPERDVKEMEQWLRYQGDDTTADDPSRRENGTTAAFDNFLQKRASTIPTQASSTQQAMYPNLQSNTHL